MRTPLALALFVAAPLAAQPPAPATPAPTWDVTQARGKTRDVDFTTSDGTWMSVDISPDGAWIVFDLLGHIYRMSSSGGEATALTQNSGVALNFQPRISPDGRLILFKRFDPNAACGPFFNGPPRWWIRDLTTNQETNISNDFFVNFGHAFSPETNRGNNQIMFDDQQAVKAEVYFGWNLN